MGQAMRRAGIAARPDIFALLHSWTRGRDWPTIAAQAIAICKEKNAGLLVVDTLSQFAGLVGDSDCDLKAVGMIV